MTNHRKFLYMFSKILGAPESEKRLSLEIFVRLISQKFELGDELKIDSLGYFAYKKLNPISSENIDFQKVILFSEEKISDDSQNVLLFFLPEESQHEVPTIDAYLNLSFGQPVITSELAADVDLLQSSSNNEMISLIESKVEKLISEATIYRSIELTDQEYTIPSKKDDIVFDTSTKNEITSDETEKEIEERAETIIVKEERKEEDAIDKFELVEPEKNEPIDLIKDDKKDEDEWIIDESSVEDEIETQNAENIESTIDGYSEVKAPLLRPALSDSKTEMDVSQKSLESGLVLKPKSRLTKKLVLALFGLIIISAAAAGIYLNYDKLKSFIMGEKIQSLVVESKKLSKPIIINRTVEFPVSYPVSKNELSDGQTPDSLIISSSVFAANLIANERNQSGEDLLSDEIKQTTEELLKVRGNIYQRGSEFLVQVSSWKSKSAAEKDLKKYIENGFSAELIEESSKNIGKYRKVMVGGFKSYDEANNFLNQNN